MGNSLSVLTTVYNAEKYIQAAVESILNQTYADFEFIIINDGSTDGTLALLEGFAVQDKRIRLISRENKGLVASLNEGLELVNTPLIARMDADDIAMPNRLEEQVAFLKLNPDVVVVGGSVIIIDDEGRELTSLSPAKDDATLQDYAIRGHCPIDHPAAMIRTEVIKMQGGYRPDFYPAEDLDLWLRLAEVGKLANLGSVVIKYRFLDNSISSTLAEKQFLAAKRACHDACKRRKISDSFDATNDWRANNTNKSRYLFTLKFGWWAFNYKNKTAAIYYGKKAVKLCPFNKESWRLLFCALFKMSSIG